MFSTRTEPPPSPSSLPHRSPWLVVLALAVCFSSCAPFVPYEESVDTNIAQPAERILYEWHDDYGPGEVSVHIYLSEQRAYYSRGGRPIGWSFVATGFEGKRTPPGTYRITEKIVDKYSNLYGWIENDLGEVVDHDASPGDFVPPRCRYVPAPMPYWMRLTSYGIGMHAGHIPVPGEPASHGCIRLPKELAPILFDAVKVGTTVVIE